MRKLAWCGSILVWVWLAVAAAQQVPRPAPDWTIQMTGNKPITLSQYRGKPVLLAFILTTCPHCRLTVAYLSKDQQKYGPRGLQVLACAIGRDVPGAVAPFVKEFHPPFPVGYNSDGDAVLRFAGYSPNHLPFMPILFFIDRHGTIREQHEGSDEMNYFNGHQEENLQKSIEALLAVGGRPAPRTR